MCIIIVSVCSWNLSKNIITRAVKFAFYIVCVGSRKWVTLIMTPTPINMPWKPYPPPLSNFQNNYDTPYPIKNNWMHLSAQSGMHIACLQNALSLMHLKCFHKCPAKCISGSLKRTASSALQKLADEKCSCYTPLRMTTPNEICSLAKCSILCISVIRIWPP